MIGLIRDEINEENFYSLYAQAHALGCERLLEDLRELSITSLLNDQTVLKLYLDADEHKDETLEISKNVKFNANFVEINILWITWKLMWLEFMGNMVQ